MPFSYVQIQVDGKTYNDIDAAYAALDKSLSEIAGKSSAKIDGSLLNVLNRIYKKLEDRHSRPWDGSAYNSSDSRLFRRSGAGLQSVFESLKVEQDGDAAYLTLKLTGYMVTHEQGATITARGGGYLAVPLPAALDSRGVKIKKMPRDWDNTFVARSKKGNLLIFQRYAGGIRPLYILKKQVRIRPRLGAAKIIEDELGYFQRKAFEAFDAGLAT